MLGYRHLKKRDTHCINLYAMDIVDVDPCPYDTTYICCYWYSTLCMFTIVVYFSHQLVNHGAIRKDPQKEHS